MSFSYINTSSWGSMTDSFCDKDKFREQSPINFKSATMKTGNAELKFSSYENTIKVDAQVHILRNDNNLPKISVLGDYNNEILVNDVAYKHSAIEMHFPAEHLLEDGSRADGEINFIHKSSDGELAVIGFTIDFTNEGISTSYFDDIVFPQKCAGGSDFKNVDASNFVLCAKDTPSENTVKPIVISGLYSMLGFDKAKLKSARFLNYSGSLTYPGCERAIRFVYEEAVKISPAKDLGVWDYRGSFDRDDNGHGTNRQVLNSWDYLPTIVTEIIDAPQRLRKRCVK